MDFQVCQPQKTRVLCHLNPKVLITMNTSQDICISGGQEFTKSLRPLLLLPSSCENAVKARSSLKPLKLVRFKRL